MAFYLLQEDGSKFRLEDLSGFLILEDESVAPTLDHQGGDGKRKGTRRKRTRELFQDMEDTLRRVLDGTIDAPLVPVATVGTTTLVLDQQDGYADALAHLRTLTVHQQTETAALAQLQRHLDDYEARLRAEQELDEEDAWSLLI